MNHPQARTALVLALLACSALPACTHDEPHIALDSSLQAPLAPGQGYSLIRTHDQRYEIAHLAVSDDYLFFSIDWYGLLRLPKYGGKADWVDEDSGAEVNGLTASGAEVFWLRSKYGPGDVPHNTAERRAAAGGSTGIVKDGGFGLVSSNMTPNLAVDAGHLYSLDETVVWVFPLAGGDPIQVPFTGIAPPDPNEPLFPNWVPDYPAIYFSACVTSTACALWKADLTDGSLANLIPLQAGAGGDSVQAVDEAFVYLVKGGNIVRMSKADLTLSDVYVPEAGLGIASALLMDESNFYFASYSPTVQLLKVPKTGGQAQPIGWGPQLEPGVWELAQDAAFVYVLAGPTIDGSGNVSGNEILMFPKTPATDAGANPPAP
jgi:hypothetical protein